MHGNSNDRRALEREALRNVINQWNANRLDLFELSEPNEDLEFHGVMRFYFQDSGQKVATKCIRVASDATVEDVIGTLVEKFRPDMRMLSVPSYALYELHEGCPERRMLPDEKPLLVQLNWHVDDREGRFLLKNIDDKTINSMTSLDPNASFKRKLSKREKKQLKKQEKLSRMKSENGDINEKEDGVAEKLYTELPETSFTRSISNPEAVMRRRRQQKLEKKLQQFRSKDGGPDTGGTLKIYGEALCKDVPYKTLLLSVRDCAGAVVREMLDKYGLHKTDPGQWCLVQVTQQPGVPDTEYVLDEDECPLSILMNAPNTGSIMFHVRRRPADCAPRKRKKKPGALGANTTNPRDVRSDSVPVLVELGPDGSTPHPSETTRTIRLTNDIMEVGSANGIGLQLYGPHIQSRHCVIKNSDGVTTLTPSHADAHTYVNGQRVHQSTMLTHGSLVKFGHSNTYRFLDPTQEDRLRHSSNIDNTRIYDSRSPRALSPTEPSRENIETTFDLEGNVETISTASGAREDSRSLGSSSENRLSGIDRYPRGQDPILPAVLEFPEEPQEQFLARVITHLDVTTPTFRLSPAYTLYLCARYRASTHYRPELTPTERAHKLTVLLQHAAMLVRHTVQDRSTESTSQAFWLANASELLHFLKSDRHVSAFSLQAQDTLADAVQLAFKNLVACLTDELNSAMVHLISINGDDHPREVINIQSGAMNLLRKCRVNAALTIQLFSQLFHWISAKALANVISNSSLCTRSFGNKLFNRLRNLQAWAESQGLELAAECHLAKIVQCAHLMQAPKYTAEDLANLSSACFKLNSMQLGALLRQYKAEPGEKLAPPALLEQAAKAAESVADELARAEGREVTLYEDPAPLLQLLLPDDGFSCDVVQGVPPGLADFLQPLQASGLCRLAAQPTSSGHWTVYMSVPRPPSALSTTQPEVQVIRLHKAGGGMGLSIVAAKGAGQERLGIYIKSVVPGGAADRDGRLAAGDQLLSVDGQSLLGITQEKAAEFLVRTGSVVTLEVAKGGAVYHGLATLLQQPSPTPHRAVDRYALQGSQESLYSLHNGRLFTPPATKPKNNVFFSSDDTLYKKYDRKFTVPRIEIDFDPVFNLQVTDFSEPSPKNIVLGYDESGTNLEMKLIKEKSQNLQQKSFSIDVDETVDLHIEDLNETDKYLSIGNKKISRQKAFSNSMQDLSSSTSSISSAIHESTLDLSNMDSPIKHKNWKSPGQVRCGGAVESKIDKATSYPNIHKSESFGNRSKTVSEENLNDRLTEFERLELLKLLHDWSLNGSDSTSELNGSFRKISNKFASEPNLSPRINRDGLIVVARYSSDNALKAHAPHTNEIEFMHSCQFRNCIFNENVNKRDQIPDNKCLKNIANSTETPIRRRNSEIIVSEKFNSQLVRCDSLERLTQSHKKFPEAYIVRSKTKPSPRVIVLKQNAVPKTWKSCSDLKPKKMVRKCCQNARRNCPILKTVERKTQSCADIKREPAARLAVDGVFDCPRRMSERDLPSKVDSERSIPSSKSVPALHHISPNSEQPRNHHDVFNPGYSRTSSNNSINTNTPASGAPNPTINNATLRSRSTHNLHQQQDGGFYQNLSVYRNKVPSPQHLGDRTSALRSSQNSVQSSVVNTRPVSAYYPPPMAVATSRSNLHQSIPNLKNPPAVAQQRPGEDRAVSYPSVAAAAHPQTYHQSQPYNPRADDRLYGTSPYQAQTLKENSSTYAPNYAHSNGQRPEGGYNNMGGGGLLREDIMRHSQNTRHDDVVRYLNPNNPRNPDMRVANDVLKHPTAGHNDMLLRYASSGNIRAHESSKVDIPLYRVKDDEEADLRRSQKFDNMDMRRKRPPNLTSYAPNYQYQHQQYSPAAGYNIQMAQNTQSMQNLTMNPPQNYPPQNYGGGYPPPPQDQYYSMQSNNPMSSPTSPLFKSPPVAPKPKKTDDPPELPPTNTHPLYSASSQDPPKMAFYPTTAPTVMKTPRDPWAREEQERQAEARREASRQWQEQQIRELLSLPHRSPQQEEQLRVLQLEREFQRRALEAAEQDDDDTEKDSSSPNLTQVPQAQIPSTANSKPENPPPSILKPGINPSPPEPVAAPPPPERGSSFTVMSMRAKENTKRVSFDTSAASQPLPPAALHLEETIREDPNSFIRQAESMLASPTTPTDASPGLLTATPGVIGAQEVYRDPRARRLAEQAQQKNLTTPVPEKLSFKEKMKMFAMETGEQETPKDKSKISRAQRDIDNLGSPNSGLVH